MIIFDSNIWVALLLIDDSLHEKAQNLISSVNERITLPEYVVGEVSSVLLIRGGKELADKFLDIVSKQESCQIIFSSQEFFYGTLALFRSQKEKNLSFIDVSLLYLSQQSVLYTFDKKLEKAIQRFESFL